MSHVVVLLGTDHHPFDRLVKWIAELDRADEIDWFVQHGHTKLPRELLGTPMLTADSLRDLLLTSDAVVTHGGPGLMMEAREAGHLPIVVPRDPKLHEHIDDHQLRFAEYVAEAQLAVVAHSMLELRDAVDGAVRRGRSSQGLRRSGRDPSDAFGALVAHVLEDATWQEHERGRP